MNEIGGIIEKASRGLGHPLYVGVDLAWAAKWLHERGIPGCLFVLEVLEQSHGTSNHALTVTPVLEQLMCAPRGEVLTIEPIQNPMIAVALCARASSDFHIQVRAQSEGGWSIVLQDGTAENLPNVSPDASPLSLQLADRDPNFRGSAPLQPLRAVPDHVWNRLAEFAHKTYVPATEQSRMMGAGAGTTDND